MFEIVQENTLKYSKVNHFRQKKIEFKPECLARSFLFSTPTYLLSTPEGNSEATWKRSYKMQQMYMYGHEISHDHIFLVLVMEWKS